MSRSLSNSDMKAHKTQYFRLRLYDSDCPLSAQVLSDRSPNALKTSLTRTNKRTNERRLAFLELLSEPKISTQLLNFAPEMNVDLLPLISHSAVHCRVSDLNSWRCWRVTVLVGDLEGERDGDLE